MTVPITLAQAVVDQIVTTPAAIVDEVTMPEISW
jgi:hypothetical protein